MAAAKLYGLEISRNLATFCLQCPNNYGLSRERNRLEWEKSSFDRPVPCKGVRAPQVLGEDRLVRLRTFSFKLGVL